MISQRSTPKLQTSLLTVNFRLKIASGAVHRTGIFPPYIIITIQLNAVLQYIVGGKGFITSVIEDVNTKGYHNYYHHSSIQPHSQATLSFSHRKQESPVFEHTCGMPLLHNAIFTSTLKKCHFSRSRSSHFQLAHRHTCARIPGPPFSTCNIANWE